jgi:hypothetical protein
MGQFEIHGVSDHVWSIEEMRSLLPEAPSATQRIDKRLILKALEQDHKQWA